MDTLLIIAMLAAAIVMNAVDIMINIARHKQALEVQQSLKHVIGEIQIQNMILKAERGGHENGYSDKEIHREL